MSTATPPSTLPPGTSRNMLWLFALPPLIVTYITISKLLDAGIVDDTYIFLRYARNFANGNGLVFNPGEFVEGYTSPLWQFILSLLALLNIDLVFACTFLSALFGLGTVLLLLSEARHWVQPGRYIVPLAAAFFLVTNPSFQYWAWSGMDTLIFTFFFFLILVTFLKEVKQSNTLFWSGIWFTLAALSRLDILVLLPVYLVAIYLFSKNQRPLLPRKYLTFLLPMLLLAAHFLWRYTYYDSWLPNTFYAKTGVPFDNLLGKGLAYLGEFVTAYWLYFLTAVLALYLARRFRQELVGKITFMLTICVVWIGYTVSVGGDHFGMHRFFVPLLPILALLFAITIDILLDYMQERQAARANLTAVLLVLIVVLFNYIIYALHGGQRGRDEVEFARRWTIVGAWLKDNVPPGSTIASMIVGAIPYYSGLETYDLLGLTDKTVAHEGKVNLDGVIGHQKYDTEYILDRHPDYIIYSSSGLYRQPTDPLVLDRDLHYDYSVYDLANNPRTIEAYRHKAIKMPSGWYIQFLESKQLANPLAP